MPHAIEPTIREILWEHLEEDLGYRVGGEVYVDNGFVDIVALTPKGEYIGYEVKDQNNLQRGGELENWFHQLRKYQDSGYLDRLYLCTDAPKEIVDKLRRSISWTLDQSRRGPTKLGALRFNYGSVVPKFEIVREAEKLNRSREPKLPTTNEAWVQHHTWENFEGVREACLPNCETNGEQRIDIGHFGGSTDPTEIFLNQSKYFLHGIEAKGADFGSMSGEEVQDQLLGYLRAGGLTELSLAVPEQSQQKALRIIDDRQQSTLSDFGRRETNEQSICGLEKVGLITVDEQGKTEQIRKPIQLEMRFDGYKLPTTYGRCKTIAWGKHGQKTNLSRFTPQKSNQTSH